MDIANLKRYKIVDVPKMNRSTQIIGDIKHGEWVKFEDIKELLNTSTKIAETVGSVRGLCCQYQVSDEAMEAIVQSLRELSAVQ